MLFHTLCSCFYFIHLVMIFFVAETTPHNGASNLTKYRPHLALLIFKSPCVPLATK